MDKDGHRSGSSRCSGSSADGDVKKVQFLPVHIGPISTLEEMDIKVLQFQNRKLVQRLEERKRLETEYKQRIEHLEMRQMQDDMVMNTVNRYWNQLNEDIRLLLQRFNAETTDESENLNECETTTSFLMQLASWDKEELTEKLANRVQVSKRAVGKIIQAFDHMLQRYEKISSLLIDKKDDAPLIEEAIKECYIKTQKENKELHELNTKLHQIHYTMNIEMLALKDALAGRETEIAELKNRLEDLEYDCVKKRAWSSKIENSLAEAMEKLKSYEQMYGNKKEEAGKQQVETIAPTNVNHKKLEELQLELEEQKELASNRLVELEATSLRLRETMKEVEKLRIDLKQLPESVIVETTEYKCLQSHFSVLYNEAMQLKTQQEECQFHLQNIKNQHMEQIEKLEAENLVAQKKLRSDFLKLEDKYMLLRHEYDELTDKLQKVAAENTQVKPMNVELKRLLASLQDHNTSQLAEISRLKEKVSLLHDNNIKLKKEINRYKYGYNYDSRYNVSVKDEELDIKEEKKDISLIAGAGGGEASSSGYHNKATMEHDPEQPEKITETHTPVHLKKEKSSSVNPSLSTHPSSSRQPSSGPPHAMKTLPVKKEPREREMQIREYYMKESDNIRDLKIQLKKALSEQKEMKLILDMYKNVSKEQREKAAIMANERRLRAELEDLRRQLRLVPDSRKDHIKKVVDDDASRRIKELEGCVLELEKAIKLHKQEEEASLCEMEVTGRAFEDMQEQNYRLLKQLHEKDDANFKLLTERLKSNNLNKISTEEKEKLHEMVTLFTNQIESVHIVVRKLEDKERAMQTCVLSMEKELILCRQTLEMHKRKAIESAQSAADLKMHLDKYHAQMKEAQQVVAEKTSSLESEAYKTNRLQEELAQYKRRVERMKKIEAAETLDAVLMEEIKEYKETLTCPSCKVHRKDAVLIKCFHVFCWDCLKTRYETRQRKCPKCNAAFGANDYHRLYLSN